MVHLLKINPPKPLFLLPDRTIHFQILDQKNSFSTGNTIEIYGIKNNQNWTNLTRLNVTGDYELGDSSILLSGSDGKNSITIQIEQQLTLNFRTRPDAGVIEVSSGDQRAIVDLYEEVPGVIPLTIKYPIPAILIVFSNILYSLGSGIVIIFLLLDFIVYFLNTINIKNLTKNSQNRSINFLLIIYLIYSLLVVIVAREGPNQSISINLLIIVFLYLSIINFKKLPRLFHIPTITKIFLEEINKQPFWKELSKQHFPDIIFILIPLTPVLQYFLNNIQLFDVIGAVQYFGLFLMICLVFAYLPSYLISPVFEKTIILIGCLSYLFMIFNTINIAGSIKSDHIAIITVIFFALLIGFQILIHFMFRNNRKFVFVLPVLLFIGTVLSSPLIKIGGIPIRPIDDEPITADIDFVNRPNIYFLVYESYSDPETLAQYGIDNSEHFMLLEEYGFNIFPGIWTTGFPTLDSISKTFTMENSVPHSEQRQRFMILGNALSHDILRKNGYQINAIFRNGAWFFSGNLKHINFDFYFPILTNHFPLDFSKQIIEGRLDDKILFENISDDEFLNAKKKFLGKQFNKPQFLYSHTNYPGHTHSRKLFKDHLMRYQRDLLIANNEMIQDVGAILAYNPDSIIILAGDHGPGLTGDGWRFNEFSDTDRINRFNLIDRYGVFLAIRLPPGLDGNMNSYQVKNLQDTIPLIFSILAEDKSIYDSYRIIPEVDVTDKIKIVDGIIQGGIDDGHPLFLCSTTSSYNCDDWRDIP
jgi:hypothetical protein